MPELAKLYGVIRENQYDDLIAAAAKANGIPFALAKGLVSVESGGEFNPRAWRAEPHLDYKDASGNVVHEGSRGLTQILYKTALGIGFTGNPEDLFDPAVNLAFGMKFLGGLLNRPNYNVPDAVAAYNAGSPRPASKTTAWIIKIYGQPQADWAYANEPYVRRVLGNAAFYLAAAEGNERAMAALKTLLKKKLPPLVPIWSWTVGSCSGRRAVTAATFDWPRLFAMAGLPPT